MMEASGWDMGWFKAGQFKLEGSAAFASQLGMTFLTAGVELGAGKCPTLRGRLCSQQHAGTTLSVCVA